MLGRAPWDRKVTLTIESAAGARRAQKTPCSARDAKSNSCVEAMPPSADAAAKPSRPMMKIFLRPTKSAIRPPRRRSDPKASVYAVTTHCWLASVIPKSAFALGIAILTIDASSTTISWAIAMTNRVRHLSGGRTGAELLVVIETLQVIGLANANA